VELNGCDFLKYRLTASSYGVGIATGYGWRAGVRFPAVRHFSLLYSVRTGSGANLASYPVGSGGSFPGDKAVGA
jgi:hypothetical protein